MITLLLLLQLSRCMFVELPPGKGEFRVDWRQIKEDTFVVLTYPADSPVVDACVSLVERSSEVEVEEHCWQTQGPKAEFYVFKGVRVNPDYYILGRICQADGQCALATPMTEQNYERGEQHECGEDQK